MHQAFLGAGKIVEKNAGDKVVEVVSWRDICWYEGAQHDIWVEVMQKYLGRVRYRRRRRYDGLRRANLLWGQARSERGRSS